MGNLVTKGTSDGSLPGAAAPYASAGVDEEREQQVFARAMRPWLARTAVRSPMVASITGLASGYFATMMHIPPGPPLALTTDGVGTKILLAREANRWEPIGIDCVANNVNDVICTGAVPLALLDYMATDRIDEDVLEEVARGLYLGATEAGIAIPGGEIAQIGAMLAPAAGGPPMLDLVGTAIGALPPGREPVDGSRVSPGDVIVALPSSGLHSNGYSLARRALFEWPHEPGQPGCPAPASASTTPCWRRPGSTSGPPRRSGRRALTRAAWSTSPAAGCSTWRAWPRTCPTSSTRCRSRRRFSRSSPKRGPVPAATMYATFNMGIGFCVIVPPARRRPRWTRLRAGEQPVAGRLRHRAPRPLRVDPFGGIARPRRRVRLNQLTPPICLRFRVL